MAASCAVKAFCTGPWVVHPAGHRAFGNQTTPEPHAESYKRPTVRLRGRSCLDVGQLSLSEMLKSNDLPSRIHPSEVDVVQRSLAGSDRGVWEQLLEQDGIEVCLAAGEPHSGTLTFKAEAELPGISLEMGADQLSYFQQRCQWDPYVVDVSVHNVRPGNEQEVPGNIFYFVVRAPPFADRDMVTQIVMCKSSNGDAYCTYCRSVDHPGYPAGKKGRIRAELCGNVVAFRRDPADPEHSSRMILITRQNFKLPFVPSWVVNLWAPSKLVDFVQRLRRSAKRRRGELRVGMQLPCAALFRVDRDARDSEDCSQEFSVASTECSTSPEQDVVPRRPKAEPAAAAPSEPGPGPQPAVEEVCATAGPCAVCAFLF